MISETSFSSLKNNHQLREYEEKKSQERKRNILCLIYQYLKDEGYSSSAAALHLEVPSIKQFEVCDNIDLSTILQDFESYFFVRLQKYPKITKKTFGEDASVGASKKVAKGRTKKQDGQELSQKSFSTTKLTDTCVGDRASLPFVGALNVTSLGKEKDTREEKAEKILKPLGALGNQNPEWLAMAEVITKDIVLKDLNVHWEDILGLDEAKRLLKEAVVYPIKYPELFSGILTPWKGLLLFGPSGTGKTMLAKAVATECKTTFFNITSSSIISKWRGDSEKLVRVMFDLARYHAPSTIFIDEIDAIASNRDGCNFEHEASRRLKTELLVQLDGLAHSQDQVFLLATSNLPWELDPALLRRLEKRILVDLPTQEAREAMFRSYLPEVVVRLPVLRCNINYETLAKSTSDYSGSDIRLVCKEATMQAIRKVFQILDGDNKSDKVQAIHLEPITTSHVLLALEKTKPSSAANVEKYKKWYKQFGSE